MNQKYLIISIIVIIAIIIVGVGATSLINFNSFTGNRTNNTLSNTTNNTTAITATVDSGGSHMQLSINKNNNNAVVNSIRHENKQAGNGSYYTQYNYADGNFRQYDDNGNIIGSSYSSDQGANGGSLPAEQ